MSSLNDVVKQAADAFIDAQSGTPKLALNDSVKEALRLYVIDKGGTPREDTNDLVVQATAYYFTEQSVSPAPISFNDAVWRATGIYLADKSEPVPMSFNERLMRAGEYYILNGGVITSAVSAFEVISGASLLDQTGDYGDGDTRTGINGNGWVVRIQMPWLAATTFDPTKIYLTVNDPGYSPDGSATTVQRIIRGTKILRRQANNEADLQHANDGLTYTAWFALTDVVFDPSTIASATAEAGFYGVSTAGNIAAPVNNSTRTYYKPFWFFYNIQQERVTVASWRVEGMAFSPWGRNGLMVPRVEFIAKDHNGTAAATQAATDTELSQLQKNGNVGECYTVNIPTTDLAQATTSSHIGTVNVKVYPWLGDSTAVLDLDTDGIAWPTIRTQTHLRFVCDKNSTYGGAIAFVKSGASGGTVYAEGNESTARANPFPTIQAAALALPGWNNTNRGHNDHSGAKIYLMDDNGANVVHAVSATMNPAVGSCWTEILPDPNNTAVASWRCGAQNRTLTSLFLWRARYEATATTDNFSGTANGNFMAAVDFVPGTSKIDVVHTSTPTVVLFYNFGLAYIRNAALSGASVSVNRFVGTSSTTRTQFNVLGLTTPKSGIAATWSLSPWMVVGCDTWRGRLEEQDTTTIPLSEPSIGGIVYNNTMYHKAAASTFATRYDHGTRGMALIQNNFERSGVASQPCLQIGADSQIQPFDGFLEMYTGTPDDGSAIGRTNRAYADGIGMGAVIKRIVSKFCLWGEFNLKRDTFEFSTRGASRHGNWEPAHHVGNSGNVAVNGAQSGDTPDATSWLGEVWPTDSVHHAASGIGVTYVNNQVGAATTGNGDYRLTGATNAAYNRVPSGMQALKRDIANVLRLNDGRGAAGPYERTDVS